MLQFYYYFGNIYHVGCNCVVLNNQNDLNDKFSLQNRNANKVNKYFIDIEKPNSCTV